MCNATRSESGALLSMTPCERVSDLEKSYFRAMDEKKIYADALEDLRQENAKLREALAQCRQEIVEYRRLSYGKAEFPPSVGMDMADNALKETI